MMSLGTWRATKEVLGLCSRAGVHGQELDEGVWYVYVLYIVNIIKVI